MIPAKEIAACNWQGAGGAETALSICTFLETIGINITVAAIDQPTLLTGMAIARGNIIVDTKQPCWPGDLLHEAGHIAVTQPDDRAALNEVSNDAGEEMAAIAWSVAAAKACNVPLETLFHAEGYKGGSQSLIDAFVSGRAFGTPLLAWYGMTSEAAFPDMIRWLR